MITTWRVILSITSGGASWSEGADFECPDLSAALAKVHAQMDYLLQQRPRLNFRGVEVFPLAELRNKYPAK